jgi:hypothetical protein
VIFAWIYFMNQNNFSVYFLIFALFAQFISTFSLFQVCPTNFPCIAWLLPALDGIRWQHIPHSAQGFFAPLAFAFPFLSSREKSFARFAVVFNIVRSIVFHESPHNKPTFSSQKRQRSPFSGTCALFRINSDRLYLPYLFLFEVNSPKNAKFVVLQQNRPIVFSHFLWKTR